jgi:Spy/CpxP family protein refolding chaperone
MNKCLAALLVLLAVVLAPVARAATAADDVTDMKALHAAVQTDKRAYVASVLKLSDAEGKRFWPIYDLYQRSLSMADRRRTRAIVEVAGADRALTDPYARSLATELIAADEAEMKARRTLQNRLMRALPPRKAARYLQLESKIRAVEAYEIAESQPLLK